MQNKERLEKIIFRLFGEMKYDENTSMKDVVKNSIGYIKFLVETESEFDIEFEDDFLDISYFDNIGQLLCYLQEHSK